MTAPEILTVNELVVGYDHKPVLTSVNLSVHAGEIVAVIGHNGAGKSTLLKSIFGMLLPRGGQIIVSGVANKRPTPNDLRRAGVCYVPQGNRVFDNLTVRENLEIASITQSDQKQLKDGLERIFSLFPMLRNKLKQRAATLSGGEKQMLALAGALILHPRLLLLDEPSLGLAPKLVSQALANIKEIRSTWQTAILIVEQKVREVLKVSDRVYVLRTGQVSYSGPAVELEDNAKLRAAFL